MSNKAGDVGEVSWKLFNDLYESQYDLLRKLKFITKAGKVNAGESVALELIDGYLRQKEIELKDLRQAALAEWTGRNDAFGLQPGPDRETPEDDCGVATGKAPDPADAQK